MMSKQPIIDSVSDASPMDFEKQLKQYQARISNILESFTDAFFEVDSLWNITYWNKEAEQLFSMTKADVTNRNLWEVFGDAIPLSFIEEYHKAVESNVARRFEEFLILKQVWLEVAAFPSGNGLSVYFKDITKNKNATAELEHERKKYNDLFNLSPVPQWVYDFNTLAFLDVNQAAMDHYGYSRADFLGMTIMDIRPMEDRFAFGELHWADVTPGLFNKSSVRHQKSNGDIILVCVEGNSVSFEDKNARLVMVIDQTKEIESSLALQESLRRFDIVSTATSDAIWDWDMLTGEVIWNQGIQVIFGYKDLTCDEGWHEKHIHQDDVQRVQENFALLIKNHATRLHIEYRFECADHAYKSVLDRAFIIFNDDGLPIRMIGSMQDITEKVNQIKAIEAQNDRLKEISWIQSHMVRNPLTKILSLVELIAENRTDLSAIAELVPLLELSAKELDQVLIEIVKKAQ